MSALNKIIITTTSEPLIKILFNAFLYTAEVTCLKECTDISTIKTKVDAIIQQFEDNIAQLRQLLIKINANNLENPNEKLTELEEDIERLINRYSNSFKILANLDTIADINSRFQRKHDNFMNRLHAIINHKNENQLK